MPLREASLCTDWGKSKIGAWKTKASGLTLLTAAIPLWNTVYIERAIDSLKRKGLPVNKEFIAHLSLLGWEYINLSGDYVWRTNLKLGQGKYRTVTLSG